MVDIELNLQRLRRHYELNVATYDRVALVDMAHALRMWVDMKDDVQQAIDCSGHPTQFLTGIVTKRIRKLVGKADYVIAYMPGGVTTRESADNLCISTGPIAGDQSVLVSHTVRIDADKSLSMASFIVIYQHFDDVDTVVEQLRADPPVNRLPFLQWLHSEAVKLQYTNAEGERASFSISRECIIDRVANVLGGSHPERQGAGSGGRQHWYRARKARFNEPVRHLMTFHLGKLPAPYFVLLKVAKDILDNLSPLFT